MAFLRITGSEVFSGTVDVLIMVIDGTQDTIQAFSGFLKTLDDDLANFEPQSSIIYKGKKAREILATAKPGEWSEYEEIRTVNMDDGIRHLMVDWLFKAEETEVIE
jgi:hypothetical protein